MTMCNRARAARLSSLKLSFVSLLTCGLLAAGAASAGQDKSRDVRLDSAASGLNLLQTPAPKAERRVQRVRQVGSGSYICSASGFGQRSRCYAN